MYLLPPSLQEWLPEDHLARFVAEVVGELDLSAIADDYERKDGRGLAAYHPELMTRLLLYAYCVGVTSSREIERASYERVPFRFLAADQHPDHDTIANFRRRHLEALAGLFTQALRLCQKAGLVKLGRVAIDGSKMLANASRRRSLSYARLEERERCWAEARRLLAEAERQDRAEDARLGAGRRGAGLPAALARAEGRLARIRQAKAELEAEARRQLSEASEAAPGGGPSRREEAAGEGGERERVLQAKWSRRRRRAARQAQRPSRQYNFVDPDSRVMRDNGRQSFEQAYNAQLAVDAHRQVIVAAEVTQAVTDRGQLVPMLERVRAVGRPEVVAADSGYWDATSLSHPACEGITVLVPPDAPAHPGAPLSTHAPRNAAAVRMRSRLGTPSGQALYAFRKATVEPVFGQIKEGRRLRRFRFRGLARVRWEWQLICATHNLLKLFRYRALAPA